MQRVQASGNKNDINMRRHTLNMTCTLVYINKLVTCTFTNACTSFLNRSSYFISNKHADYLPNINDFLLQGIIHMTLNLDILQYSQVWLLIPLYNTTSPLLRPVIFSPKQPISMYLCLCTIKTQLLFRPGLEAGLIRGNWTGQIIWRSCGHLT